MERCEACGFDPQSVTPATAADSVRAFARRYQAPLTRFLPTDDPAVVLSTPAEPDGWSALQYAGHVRDVFDLFSRRIAQLRAADGAELEVVDHDALVAGGGYDELDPAELAQAIAAAAETLAAAFASLAPEEWERVGTRAGEPRSMLDIARRSVHEGSHHLLDIGRTLRAARGR